MDSRDGAPRGASEKAQNTAGLPRGRSSVPDAPSPDLPRSNSEMQVSGSSSTSPRMAPVPNSPTLPVRLPASPSLSVQLPAPVSSFDKNCTLSQAPVANHGRNDRLPYDQTHGQCEKSGFRRKDSRAASKIRLAPMDAEAIKRTLTEETATDTSA